MFFPKFVISDTSWAQLTKLLFYHPADVLTAWFKKHNMCLKDLKPQFTEHMKYLL